MAARDAAAPARAVNMEELTGSATGMGTYRRRTWFVRGEIAASGDGTSWTTAFKTPQEAITAEAAVQAVATGDGAQIIIGPGVYTAAGGNPVLQLDSNTAAQDVAGVWIRALNPDTVEFAGQAGAATNTVELLGVEGVTIDGIRFSRAAYDAGSADIHLNEDTAGPGTRAADFTRIINCNFSTAPGAVNVHSHYSIEALGAAHMEVANCVFMEKTGAANGVHIFLDQSVTFAGGGARIHHCTFHGAQDYDIDYTGGTGVQDSNMIWTCMFRHGAAGKGIGDIPAPAGSIIITWMDCVCGGYANAAAFLTNTNAGGAGVDYTEVGNTYAV